MTATTEMQSRWVTCSTHETEYFQVYMPAFEMWSGECKGCKAQQELERRAQDLLPRHRDEILRRVEQEMKRNELQIEKDIEDALKGQVDKWRAYFQTDIQNQWRDHLRNEAEQEVLETIIAELQGKGE